MFITTYLSNRIEQYNRKRQPSDEEYHRMLPQFEESPGIAKNIFQIHLSGENSVDDAISILPSDFIENINKLKNNNPDYNFHLYSDKKARQFILQYYGNTIWDYYQRIDNEYLAAKADFLRYLLLYALGGVYIDLKATIDRPLSETIRETDRFLIFYWDNMPNGQHHYLIPEYISKGEMLQGFIISSRGNSLLREVILNVLKKMDNYNPYKDGVGWAGTLNTAGPAIYTKTLYKAIELSANKSFFREGKPFGEFGYKVYFAGKYSPGIYQKSLSLKDYRKSSRPVIICKNKHLQKINVHWLKILSLYRKAGNA